MDNQNLALETKTDLMLSKEYAERRELSSRLRKVILALSRGQRQTITLYYFGKLDISEIAGIFDCGENAVKAHLLLALGSIQTEIRELEQQSDAFWRDLYQPAGAVRHDEGAGGSPLSDDPHISRSRGESLWQ